MLVEIHHNGHPLRVWKSLTKQQNETFFVSLAIKENNLTSQSLKNLTPEQQKSYITYIQIFVRSENLTEVCRGIGGAHWSDST